MAINNSGAVLMEPLPQNRRPGPPMGPHGNYPRPNPNHNNSGNNSNNYHLPPVHQSQNSSNGVWRGGGGGGGGPMPPPSHAYGSAAGSPRPGSSTNSPPMLMRGGSGPTGSPMPPGLHPPPGMNYPNHSPRPMPPHGMTSGIPPRPLVGPPSSPGQPPPPPQQQQAAMMHGQRPPSGSGSPSMPPVNLSSINNTSMASNPVNGSRGGVGQRPPMPPQPHHPQQPRPPQQQQVRRGPRVPSVTRGPQPTSTEPTRLRDGRKIKDVQRHQQQQNGAASQGEAPRGPHRFTGPGKNGMAQKQNGGGGGGGGNNEPRPIKTTVGNDESWVKGLTYSTWIDSPRGNLNDLDSKDGPYKRQGGNNNNNNRRRKPQKKDSNSSSNSGGVMEMLRNLFR